MAEFLSIEGQRNVINNRDSLYEQGSTPKCLHKLTIITAQISYITRKIKQTNGREKVMIHKYQCIPFQGKTYQDIDDQVCIGMQGVKESCR